MPEQTPHRLSLSCMLQKAPKFPAQQEAIRHIAKRLISHHNMASEPSQAIQKLLLFSLVLLSLFCVRHKIQNHFIPTCSGLISLFFIDHLAVDILRLYRGPVEWIVSSILLAPINENIRIWVGSGVVVVLWVGLARAWGLLEVVFSDFVRGEEVGEGEIEIPDAKPRVDHFKRFS
ncbi:hypothetical protein EJ04DRAFT_569811 [Polyplosphaeria fusca]|uniref:Uncharacterized protein n=1 Tax=Polyplosphaeria fusca TaxID=682080 RepID=A0A9P4UTQ6_9PLEO|nr:hypothetical protein EJ04DRAFT_569811 [Polyplosphaeria fusca]